MLELSAGSPSSEGSGVGGPPCLFQLPGLQAAPGWWPCPSCLLPSLREHLASLFRSESKSVSLGGHSSLGVRPTPIHTHESHTHTHTSTQSRCFGAERQQPHSQRALL